MELSQFSIKILPVNFATSIFNNSNWDKLSEGIIKNPNLGHSETLHERWKDNRKPDPLIQTVVQRLHTYYSKIYQEGN